MSLIILKQGKLPTYSGTCNNCDCEVKCNHGDFKIIKTEFGHRYIEIPCPTKECNNNIILTIDV